MPEMMPARSESLPRLAEMVWACWRSSCTGSEP